MKRDKLPLAALAWWAFLLSLMTGVILAFHYQPWGDVFKSVSKLTGYMPYGVFLRRFHYLAGQLFLILTFAHTAEHLLRKTYRRILPQDWLRLVLVFSLCFPLVFTGFVLKGDKEGILAGQVMYNLAREIPCIGSVIAQLLLRPGEAFFLLPYLHHTVILPLMVIFLLEGHRRRLFPRKEWGWPLLALLSTLSLFYPLPPDIPPHVEVSHIAGPWFFHGIQVLLRYLPAFWAGVVWPLIPLGLLAVLPILPSKLIKPAERLLILVWVAHGVMIILG